jgi:hypothetical protein
MSQAQELLHSMNNLVILSDLAKSGWGLRGVGD